MYVRGKGLQIEMHPEAVDQFVGSRGYVVIIEDVMARSAAAPDQGIAGDRRQLGNTITGVDKPRSKVDVIAGPN